MSISWLQIQIEDLWVTRSIADFCWGSTCEQIDYKLNANSNWRSMSDKINRGFLLRICVWAGWSQVDCRFKFMIYEWQVQSRILVEDLHMNRLNRVSIDQETVAHIWLWWCKGCSGCPEMDLRWIRVTEEPGHESTIYWISWCNGVEDLGIEYDSYLSLSLVSVSVYASIIIGVMRRVLFISIFSLHQNFMRKKLKARTRLRKLLNVIAQLCLFM